MYILRFAFEYFPHLSNSLEFDPMYHNNIVDSLSLFFYKNCELKINFPHYVVTIETSDEQKMMLIHHKLTRRGRGITLGMSMCVSDYGHTYFK